MEFLKQSVQVFLCLSLLRESLQSLILTYLLIAVSSTSTGYVNCFVDSPPRLFNYYFISLQMDNNRCILHCRDNGYSFAGSQNTVECWCGNDPYKWPNRITTSGCNMSCAGDSSQMCGGKWRLSIYKTDYLVSASDSKLFSKVKVNQLLTSHPIAVAIKQVEVFIKDQNSLCAVMCSIDCRAFASFETTKECILYTKYEDLCIGFKKDNALSVFILV